MSKRQYVIYVAGKYSGTADQIKENIKIARKWAIKIWELGFTAICPHLNTMNFEEDCSIGYNDYLEGDFHIIDRCDGMFMIPENWKISGGARDERQHAIGNGQPVFYDIVNLPLHNWVDPWAVNLQNEVENE